MGKTKEGRNSAAKRARADQQDEAEEHLQLGDGDHDEDTEEIPLGDGDTLSSEERNSETVRQLCTLMGTTDCNKMLELLRKGALSAQCEDMHRRDKQLSKVLYKQLYPLLTADASLSGKSFKKKGKPKGGGFRQRQQTTAAAETAEKTGSSQPAEEKKSTPVKKGSASTSAPKKGGRGKGH